MNTLALDLGTHCGYAYNQGETFSCGTWVLASKTEIRQWGRERKTRTDDPRIKRLCEKFAEFPQTFDLVVFEDVQFSTYTLQTQLWSALRASVWLCSGAARIDCVPVKTLKLFAGSGNADKKAMSRFLQIQHPGLWKLTNNNDNTIDAVWIWLWAKHTFARMK